LATTEFRPELAKKKFFDALVFLFVLIYALGCLLPFAWSLLSSVKTNEGIFGRTFSLPKALVFSNYTEAWYLAKFRVFFVNTIIYAVAANAVLLVITPMAAFIIAKVKDSRLLYTFFTLGLMIPSLTILLPTFIMIRRLGLVNTRLGIVLVFIAFNIPLSIFILVGFMKNLPNELDEAALIDGCSRAQSFFRIIFPLCAPGMATVGILAFLNTWNDFLIPLVLLTQTWLKPITLGVYELRGPATTNYGLVMAGVVISVIPAVLIYILLQEKVIAGMTAGAVKG
jgi:raffinose/stachyose/melibiose transport system permease protein